jgi:hypothetical protein
VRAAEMVLAMSVVVAAEAAPGTDTQRAGTSPAVEAGTQMVRAEEGTQAVHAAAANPHSVHSSPQSPRSHPHPALRDSPLR